MEKVDEPRVGREYNVSIGNEIPRKRTLLKMEVDPYGDNGFFYTTFKFKGDSEQYANWDDGEGDNVQFYTLSGGGNKRRKTRRKSAKKCGRSRR